MSHTQHGVIAGDTDTGGVVDLTGAGLLRDTVTLALDTADPRGNAIALQLSGRINKTADTLQTVWLMSVDDAGLVAGMLADAAQRADGRNGLTAFMAGLEQGLHR